MQSDLLRHRTAILMVCCFLISGESIAQDVMSVMKSNSRISNFVEALEKAQLNDRLNGNGPYTVFAPSNEVFNNQNISNQERTRAHLLNYIMTGMATERNLKAMSNITTLGGKVLVLNKSGSGDITIDNSQILSGNIRASNGVIHIIDGTF